MLFQCHSRESGGPERFEKTGFPASSAGQALLEFIPVKTGAGMTFGDPKGIFQHPARLQK